MNEVTTLERTDAVTVDECMARNYIPGGRESGTAAIKHAGYNRVDATESLVRLRGVSHDDDRLHMMAIEEIEKAICRIDTCHLDDETAATNGGAK